MTNFATEHLFNKGTEFYVVLDAQGKGDIPIP